MTPLVLHLLVLLLLPPILLGVITRTKACFAGRQGPPILQPWYDIRRLLGKGLVLSQTTTWVFQAGPLITLAAVLVAGLIVPLGGASGPVSFTGDLIFFAYLLGLARFFTTAAALDTGSAFEGMGAAREVTFACLTEPALFFALLMLVKLSGSLNLAGLLHGATNGPTASASAAMVLVAIGLFFVLLAETSRIPVDDPNTHLELTMIHEVMVLDHSGPLLGAILYGAALKLLILGSIFIQVACPWRTGNPYGDWALLVGQLLVLAVLIGVVESVMARLQMRRVPFLLLAAVLFCGFGCLLLVR